MYPKGKELHLQIDFHNHVADLISCFTSLASNRLGRIFDSSSNSSTLQKAEQDAPLDNHNTHLTNIGKLIEEMEIKMRATIQEIYFGKTKDILNDLRSMTDLKTVKGQNAMVKFRFDR